MILRLYSKFNLQKKISSKLNRIVKLDLFVGNFMAQRIFDFVVLDNDWHLVETLWKELFINGLKWSNNILGGPTKSDLTCL